MSPVHASFKDVQKSYDGETLVVKKLNLDVLEGEFLTMLGPSGSGKTTCLMMLAGFETVTHGEIYIREKPIARIPPHQRGIGMVFQNYALFPHMTVRENLAFPLQVRKIAPAEIQQKIEHALKMVCLEQFADRFPGQLSGGQQQRVAVARALVFNPELVLMDEPLGALDKNLREQMQYELKHIHEQLGVTVVYVTHDQSEALTMSNRIAVFNQGIIQQLASPNELYEEPKNAFVAQFIGENNRFCGTVSTIESNICNVDVAGKPIRARAVCASANAATTLSLRPERVLVSNTAEQADNCFTGHLQEKIYLGDHIRLRFSLLGSDEFIVKIPNNGNYTKLNVGDSVPVGWQAHDCHALDA
ncbi:MAG: ABC transporter ATP-binding protein [Proteobacteria bacterium]|nr:ABC transporter ATP-binding protein [Pseudomonadota bacterium]